MEDRQPFLTLSELENGKDSPIFQELRDRYKNNAGYQRRYGNYYIGTRKKIENNLRRLFIERGGNPLRKYPFYFVLGSSTWFKHLIENQIEVRIPICDLNSATTSFTFPDSYIALTNNKKPYHGKIFLLHELKSFIDKYGMPGDDDSRNYEHYWEGDFEKYIEFQIWENNIVEPFIDKYFRANDDKRIRPK
ncbi:hypothetical protein [Pleurocapsa sp. PCC 7319]|uniref:hypothetical protein n=1 Tax=Pleurocapsa sp. PCC 7319 TaxID=118161 RepID=UPI001181925D|nr:hypothetical protein [Pleurocapsa sp. PCC 7319]